MKPTLTDQDFRDAAAVLSCDVTAIRAVCQVEAPKGGFNPDNTPVTLFEGHKFYKYTGGKFAVQAPDLCFKTWTRAHYGKTWEQEQSRLQRAIALDRDAAIRSASWGKFQIMGFNHAMVGFPTLQAFVNAMYASEREHLLAFIRYVQTAGLATALRQHDWAAFAGGYNGPAYAENNYHGKMETAFVKFEAAA